MATGFNEPRFGLRIRQIREKWESCTINHCPPGGFRNLTKVPLWPLERHVVVYGRGQLLSAAEYLSKEFPSRCTTKSWAMRHYLEWIY